MRVNEGIFRDILRLIVWFPIRWLIKIIPVDLSFFLFKLMGDLHFLVGDGKKRRLLYNFRNFSNLDKNAVQTARRYYELHYLDRLHIFIYPRLTTIQQVKKYVYFANIELLERELEKGKGVLLIQPHFGPVQITLLSLALYGYHPIQIGFPSNKGLSKIGRSIAFRYRLKYEAFLPAPIISASGYLGMVYKHLRNGGVVLTTGDGAGGDIFLGAQRKFTFIGSERMFPLGPATWAIKTGAAFVPTFIIPETHKRFKIVFEDPVCGNSNNLQSDRIYMTRQFLAITESYIKMYPHCWHFWDEI